jgi:hypothetical protein
MSTTLTKVYIKYCNTKLLLKKRGRAYTMLLQLSQNLSKRDEENLSSRGHNIAPVKGSNVLKVKHIAFQKRLFDFLIGPIDKHFIVVGGFFYKNKLQFTSASKKNINVTIR